MAASAAQSDLYRSEAFVVTDSSVRQGRFEAVALSRDTIVSTYPRSGRELHFRFSLNGADNEFRPGTQHTLYVRPTSGRVVSPVYVFGQEQPPVVPTPEMFATSEEGEAQVTLRLDLRGVLESLRRTGSYRPPEGPAIAREEFRSVYAIGDIEPLSWDWRLLRPGAAAELKDPDGDGIYEVDLAIRAEYTRPIDGQGRALWARRADISAFPQLRSPHRLVDALYRMSLEELTQLVRDDGALAAGAKWPGVWTRDVAYASVLSLALVAPDAVRRSLLAKIDSAGRIIQDTGTGGSWPVSTDRTTWALAAWELFAATGDRQWLRRSFDVIRRSVEADRHVALDPRTGLVRGESSFTDWREQSYPRWMDPRDIAQSAALGTNVVHFATYRVLGQMASALGEPSDGWNAEAERLRASIDRHFWQPDLGWYGSFLYGRAFASLTRRSDGLGEALAVIYGVADATRRRQLSAGWPTVAFGTPIFWPYIPDVAVYHNAAVWPFVNAFAAWAAAESGNTSLVEHALASVYRPAALFLTNKENMVAATGHFDGTVLNSDRQLWSVAGNLAASYRVLFGIRMEGDRIAFRPVVPPAYGGERTLSGLRYRDARITVTVEGFGDAVESATLDGRPMERAEVPASLLGEHALRIRMNGRWPAGRIHLVENRFAPGTPEPSVREDTVAWAPVQGASRYVVHRDGQPTDTMTQTRAAIDGGATLAEFQVLALDSTGLESFLSEPVRVAGEGTEIVARPAGAVLEREHSGFSGQGYVKLITGTSLSLDVPVTLRCGGDYLVTARYANGSGPINTDSKAAIRSLLVDGVMAGALVMPQRGEGRWSDWGYSTAVRVSLRPGSHLLTLRYTRLDANMDLRVNEALLDHLRLTRLRAESGGQPGACR